MENLNQEVVQMASLAREAVEKAVRCIVNKDPSLKGEVERLDKEIYHMEQIIERRCLDLIALHTPVAGDLRTVSTCLKIITDLNRIGRYASDIVEVYDVVASANGFRKPVNIPHMASLVVAMVTDATDSFVRRDDKAARELFERDDEVDCLYDLNFRAILTYMLEDSRKITVGTHIILIARYLERIADHACNIGERVVYMVTGERMNPKDRKKSASRSCANAPYTIDRDDHNRLERSDHDLAEK
ncbi:MAG: phosphate signaling complex protein PhoU [Methanomassiliicoccales archaeon]|nr:phosphate signaling complex protein PhoU [Methanomassiliicoccales archaeon]MDD1757032.1 phosphate signaling complex protein PhoU [Methanomassiliicoccales archaeon]